MRQLKYVSPLFNEIYLKKNIIFKDTRLKTVNLINLIDMFLNRYIFFNKDNIKLNSRILKLLYGNTYNKYIEYLEDNEFIYLYKNYSSGLKSKCYRLTDKSKQLGYLSVNVDIPIKLLNKLTIINNNFNGIDDNIKNKLIGDLYKVELNLDICKTWIDTNIDKTDKAHFVNLTNCIKINNKDIYYSFDNYGRFHTNFTVLKKELRTSFITLDKNKIKEIDITNSQPFFLYLLMRNNGFTNFNGFDKDVLSGKIYDKITEITGKNRKEVKINIYSVLFGRNMSKGYWNNLFNELYPGVYDWICKYKKDNKSYKAIAQKLQIIESEFMFKKLIPKIIEHDRNIPIITIHDSIIIPEYAYNDVKEIFISCLTSLIINKNAVLL